MKQKNKFILILGIIILLIGGAAMYYYKTHYITVQFQKHPFPEITGNLERPECGWYQLYSYTLAPNTQITDDKLYVVSVDSSGYPYRLALLEFNLAGYSNGALDSVALANIKRVFELFSNTKMKLIIRFLYDWNGDGYLHEPKERTIIEKHIKQVSKVLNQYKEQIFTTQGIFVGSWAEMHDSKFLSTESITSLILCYAGATDASIFLAVRTPAQYQSILKELEEHPDTYKKYGISSTKLKKRLGLFNDGLLGSYSDLGTYQTVDAIQDQTEQKKRRDEELEFQNELCRNVPNGGEVLHVNALNDGENAVSDFSKMHISYLNQDYDTEVINKWKNTTIQKEKDVYNGFSYYDYITEHLGARFVLTDCKLKYKPFQKEDASGQITLINKGFSNLYKDKDFSLFLIDEKTKQETVLLTQEDISPKDWNPAETTTIPFSFSPFSYEDGRYQLVIRLKEQNTGTLLSFANSNYDETAKGYLLGTITIKR